ncbi:putative protein S-acyltransferase [Helianthus anomalus]
MSHVLMLVLHLSCHVLHVHLACIFWCVGADPADAGVFKSRKYCITPNSQTDARKEGSNHGGESLTKDANDERSKTVNATLSPSCLMESSQHQTSEDGIFFCSLCEVEIILDVPTFGGRLMRRFVFVRCDVGFENHGYSSVH